MKTKKYFFLFILLAFSINASAQTYINVVINQLPNPSPPVISQTGNILTSTSLAGNQWYELSTGILSGETGQTYTITSNGNYFVIVSDNNCWSDSSNIISSFTGIGELNAQQEDFTIFPNPANEVINIYFNNSCYGNNRIEIISTIGQIVNYKNLSLIAMDHLETINISKLQKGIYLLRIISDEHCHLFTFIKN